MAEKISLEMVKELRERTGLGMAKCKAALTESNGDMNAAIESLAKKGVETAAKKAGRDSSIAVIDTVETDSCIAMVEVTTETDFVAKNEQFREFVRNIATEVAQNTPADMDAFMAQAYSKESGKTIEDYRVSMVASIGENIQIRRFTTVAKNSDMSVGVYSHLGGKVVCIIEIDGADNQSDLARSIAIHTAAMDPDYMSSDDVPADVVEAEKASYTEEAARRGSGNVEKMVEGKLKNFYDSVCLLRQSFVQDESQTITQLLESHSQKAGKALSIKGYTRWSAGQA